MAALSFEGNLLQTTMGLKKRLKKYRVVPNSSELLNTVDDNKVEFVLMFIFVSIIEGCG